jgi:hypothetical protein
MISPTISCKQPKYSPDVGVRILAADHWLNPFASHKPIKQPIEMGSNPIIRNGLGN